MQKSVKGPPEDKQLAIMERPRSSVLYPMGQRVNLPGVIVGVDRGEPAPVSAHSVRVRLADGSMIRVGPECFSPADEG